MDTDSKELERLENRMVDLDAVIAKLEMRLNNLQSTAFSLANYYFVFQGVILTIVCNGAKNLKPSDRWFLSVISILAVSLNLLALILNGIKYIELKGRLEDIVLSRNKVYGKITLLKLNDHDCSNEEKEDENEAEKRKLCKDRRERKRRIYLAVCMILFLGFAVVILVGCWIFLGDRNEG